MDDDDDSFPFISFLASETMGIVSLARNEMKGKERNHHTHLCIFYSLGLTRVAKLIRLKIHSSESPLRKHRPVGDTSYYQAIDYCSE